MIRAATISLNPQKRERGTEAERKMSESEVLIPSVDTAVMMPPLEIPDLDDEEELQLWQFPNDFDEEEWEW
jgi:hypothetical protein